MDRADIVHEAFVARVSAGEFPSGDAPSGPLSETLRRSRFFGRSA